LKVFERKMCHQPRSRPWRQPGKAATARHRR
jgi:hypothetical protein